MSQQTTETKLILATGTSSQKQNKKTVSGLNINETLTLL